MREYFWYKGNTNIPWRNEQREKIMPGKEIKGRSKRVMYRNGSLKPVNKTKNPGLSKLPTKVRNKMGFMKKGGKVK